MKKLINKNEKGITLIALVITIIVLLILAGVAISMLAGENGIITKTNSAKTENETATVEEQVKLAVMAALAAGNGEIKGTDAFNALNDGLDEAGYGGDDIEEGDLPATITIDGNDYVIEANGTARQPNELEKLIGGEAVSSSKILKDAKGKQVVIPELFKVAEDSATLVKDGIVVIAPDESEFVWVPVEDISTMYGTNKDGDKLGKLYDWNNLDENGNPANLMWIELEGVMKWTKSNFATGDAREPDLVTDYDNNIEYNNGIVTASGLKKEFDEMIESVSVNKGFYIGRYETSLDDNNNAQSVAGIKSATANTTINDNNLMWYGLYQIEKDYSKKVYDQNGNTLESIIGSSMIWDSQYDQMMIWMSKNNYNVTSTNTTDLKGAVCNDTKITGNSNYNDILNNVYDLLGCEREWTLGADGSISRSARGGMNGRIASPSYRTSTNVNVPAMYFSSRLTLYVK